jgi:hypothetical protein
LKAQTEIGFGSPRQTLPASLVSLLFSSLVAAAGTAVVGESQLLEKFFLPSFQSLD